MGGKNDIRTCTKIYIIMIVLLQNSNVILHFSSSSSTDLYYIIYNMHYMSKKYVQSV